jgi:hypothetical protein
LTSLDFVPSFPAFGGVSSGLRDSKMKQFHSLVTLLSFALYFVSASAAAATQATNTSSIATKNPFEGYNLYVDMDIRYFSYLRLLFSPFQLYQPGL